MWKEHNITVRKDGSFVVVKDGHPYHVPNEGKWSDEWSEVHAYTMDHPNQVKAEEVPVEPEPTLDEARATKLAEILGGANTMSATIKAKYSQPEIDSWQQQEIEARALLADANATAPLVRDLAANDGVSPAEFARRVVNNADATKAIMLQQRAMEKQLKAADGLEAVQAIEVNYTV